MIYKIGDRVRFTFLGQRKTGTIVDKVDKVKWKIKCDTGTIYPFIYEKEPIKVKGQTLDKVLGVIIEKI